MPSNAVRSTPRSRTPLVRRSRFPGAPSFAEANAKRVVSRLMRGRCGRPRPVSLATSGSNFGQARDGEADVLLGAANPPGTRSREVRLHGLGPVDPDHDIPRCRYGRSNQDIACRGKPVRHEASLFNATGRWHADEKWRIPTSRGSIGTRRRLRVLHFASSARQDLHSVLAIFACNWHVYYGWSGEAL